MFLVTTATALTIWLGLLASPSTGVERAQEASPPLTDAERSQPVPHRHDVAALLAVPQLDRPRIEKWTLRVPKARFGDGYAGDKFLAVRPRQRL